MRFFKMDNSTKRLFEVVIDDLDEVLSQAVDKHEREEAFSNDGLDEILSQSLDMFEEVKNSVEDAIDITDMFEFGGPSLVMARRFATKKGEEIYIFDYFYVLISLIALIQQKVSASLIWNIRFLFTK